MSRRVGVCMCDVRGKAEKCLAGESWAASDELSKGDTGDLGSNTPRERQSAEGSAVGLNKHKK